VAASLVADDVRAQGAGIGTGRVGSAVDIRGTVESNVQGRAYPLSRGGVVYRQQWVNTREKSVAGLEFIDQSKMHIGPTSSVKVDPKLKEAGVAIRVTRGTEYRMKRAPADKTTYRIRDPNGTLTLQN